MFEWDFDYECLSCGWCSVHVLHIMLYLCSSLLVSAPLSLTLPAPSVQKPSMRYGDLHVKMFSKVEGAGPGRSSKRNGSLHSRSYRRKARSWKRSWMRSSRNISKRCRRGWEALGRSTGWGGMGALGRCVGQGRDAGRWFWHRRVTYIACHGIARTRLKDKQIAAMHAYWDPSHPSIHTFYDRPGL